MKNFLSKKTCGGRALSKQPTGTGTAQRSPAQITRKEKRPGKNSNLPVSNHA